MHIQQIEIDNFKSFANKTVVPFERGFTTISGPNGSGKSNIIDSILFCLGLSSSRTMRAEKLTDLINNLSRRREASVSIMFGASDSPSDEKVIVARRIKDNGATGYGSTYYLNGRVATLTEIHDRLSQHNISPGAYNVLMQGDVTGIINMSAVERRKIIDEIAGVAEFDRKIDQAQRELDTVAASTERFKILLGELQARVTQLATEREQALKYQTLRDEKTHHEKHLLTAKFLDLQNALKAAEANIVDSRKRKSLTYQSLTDIEAKIAITRDELTAITNEVKRKGEDQQIALKKQIEGLKGAISRKTDSIQFGKEKQQENARLTERAKDELQRLEEKIAELIEAAAAFDKQTAEITEKMAAEQAQLDQLQHHLDTMLDATGTLGEKRTRIRTELTAAEDQLAGLNRRKLDVEAELERQQRDKAYHEERASQGGGRYTEVVTRRDALDKAVANTTLERQAFDAQIQQQVLLVAQLKVAWNAVSAEVQRLQREVLQLDAQKRAYEDMNFGRSVDTILNAGMRGVHGTIAQLGTADEDCATALEIALGGRMKSIVVDDESIAQDGIELLQRSRAGRATFLPMSKIRGNASLPLLPDDDGIIDYAMNLMTFDSRFRDIFSYALGDTVIVEDITVARRYLRKYRMVTLDGSLFEKTGAITGGSNQGVATGKLASGKFDQQLRELRETLDAKDLEQEKARKALTAAELKLDGIKEDFANFMTEAQRNQLELDSLTRELKTLQPPEHEAAALKALEEKIAALTTEQTTVAHEIAADEAAVAALRESLEAIDAQLPTGEMERLKSEIDDVAFQIRAYETQLRNVAADKQSRQLEKEFQEKGIGNYTDQLAQIEVQNAAINAERKHFLEEIMVIEIQIKALEAQTGELDEELQRLQAEREVIQNRLITEEQEKYNLNRELSLIDEQILSYQARKRELAPEVEAAKLQLTESGLNPETVTQAELPPADDILKEIARIERKMEAMGAVNMRAIQDYDEVMSRHTELEGKIETLNRENTDLTIRIAGYGELKRNAFMTAFENVDANFREIFAELSDGEGRLVLTNPEEPFLGGLTIEARPRDKKMQRLESMSGGEKSMTALAVVFAFQRYMPAPFYAFDEIDQNLDGINVEKVAYMVKKQSANNGAQFVIVSHRRPMLEHSDRTVGVTQKRDGITKVTGVTLKHDA